MSGWFWVVTGVCVFAVPFLFFAAIALWIAGGKEAGR